MNKNAINKIRKKFMFSSMLALTTTMILMASFLYVTYMVASRHSVRATLDYIIKNNGDIETITITAKTFDDNVEDRESTVISMEISDDGVVDKFLSEIFATNDGYESPEFKYSLRYFAVLYDDNNNIKDIKTSHIASVTEDEAREYGDWAKKNRFKFGRKGYYYYKVEEYSDGSSIVVYLDSTQTVAAGNRILNIAFLLIAIGMVISFILVKYFSKRAIETEIKNVEAQNQFITNASHELKTPLAVIRANTEMTEMLQGESEWTTSTMKQVDRLNGLIKNLMLIVKAEEKLMTEDVSFLDISAIVKDTVETYTSLAISEGKTLDSNVIDNVKMKVSEAHIRQLITIFLDNALKYCDDNGKVGVILAQKGKGIVFTVYNSYKEGANVDYSRFLDRFYREDKSHNVDKGGYGVGLSIAESLVNSYKGRININWKDEVIYFTVELRKLI